MRLSESICGYDQDDDPLINNPRNNITILEPRHSKGQCLLQQPYSSTDSNGPECKKDCINHDNVVH